ncbi:MAG TPA: exosortase/archaeosortase family protein [Opitutaceae bacterium]
MPASPPPVAAVGGWRAPLAGAVAGGGIAGALALWPALEMELLARSAGWCGALFTGGGIARAERGWLFFAGELPVMVTEACSGADFCVLVAALLGWQWARRGGASLRSLLCAALTGLVLAVPLSIAINALRIALLAQAHRWLIPQLPAAYGPSAHLFLGVLIFLPALIGLDLAFESHANRRLLAAPGPRR